MLKIVAIALALAVCSGPAFAAKAKGEQTKKGRSYEECQKRAQALGMRGGGNRSNPTSPNATGYMAQCMRGEV